MKRRIIIDILGFIRPLTRMHCLAREKIASKECRIIGCSHELGNELVLEVTLLKKNTVKFMSVVVLKFDTSLHTRVYATSK